MGSVNVSQAAGGRGVSATISWTTGPEVTVKITGNAGYGARAYWRIRGQGSDTTRYINDTDADSGTFNAENGKSYAFQAVWGSASSGDIFTVNFDSGGSSGSDTGGDTTESVYLWLQIADGVEVVIDRVHTNAGNKDKGSYTGILTPDVQDEDEDGVWNGYEIWYQDEFKITATALEGYTLNNLDIFCLTYYDSYYGEEDVWVYEEDDLDEPSIYVSAKLSGIVYIDNGTTQEAYQTYIDNGTSWDQHIPYIDNGSDWDVCG